MQQGRARDNETECWWCGAPLKEHGTSEYGKLNIGSLCDHEKWIQEQEHDRPAGAGDERAHKHGRGARPTLNPFDPF